MTETREQYGLGDFRIGEVPEPTAEYVVRRRIGEALKIGSPVRDVSAVYRDRLASGN